MKRKDQFDEVMIVNPSGSGTHSDQRVRLMRFHNIYTPTMAGYAEPDAYGYYAEPEPIGYYAATEPYGYFAENPMYAEVDPTVGYWGEVDPTVGYYGEVDPTVGYWGQADPTVGYYGEPDPVGYYAEETPVGYYGEEVPLGYYGYGENPEMVGYGEQEFAEVDPGVSYYGEPDYSGYVRDGDAAFNAGCSTPSNVSGFEDGFSGYSRPATVNPSCDQMTPQPGSSPSPPETFKPLW